MALFISRHMTYLDLVNIHSKSLFGLLNWCDGLLQKNSSSIIFFRLNNIVLKCSAAIKRVWKYIFTFDRNKHLLLMKINIYFWWKYIFTFDGNTYLLLIDINIYFWLKYIFTFDIYFFMAVHTYWLWWKYILTATEILLDFWWKYIFILLEIHIYFCWKYIFTFDGNTYLLLVHLEGLHLLLLSSGPVDCSDQKGIDDPFSELIDIERHLIRFHISSPQKDTQTQKHKDPKTQRHKNTKTTAYRHRKTFVPISYQLSW